MSTTPNLAHLRHYLRENETPERKQLREDFENRACHLALDALAAGFRLTIENVSEQPPAMRNYAPHIHVYESRK